jgi:hypothetical protein
VTRRGHHANHPARNDDGQDRVELQQLLQWDGLLTEAQAAAAMASFRERGGLLVDHVCAAAGVSHARVALSLARQLGLPSALDEDVVVAARSLAVYVPESLARQHRVVPFELAGNVLKMALYDPTILESGWTGPGADVTVQWYVGAATAVEAALARLYPNTLPRSRSLPPPDVEVPNQDFGEFLGLTSPDAAAPVLLFQRKPDPAPLLLTRKKQDAPRVASLGLAAEKMFGADNLHQMATVVTTYLGNFFPRSLVLDLFRVPARVLAVQGAPVELELTDVHTLPGLGVMLTETSPYYGDAVRDPAWEKFYAQLGGAFPSGMLVMPVWQGDHARLMVYADQPAGDRYSDIHEFHNLAREMGMALESRGF